MLITLQGWPRGQGRDAPMSAIYIHKPHRRIEVMTCNPTSFRIIWKIHKNNHLPRPYASECAGMRVDVEGAAKSLHLPHLYALQVTPAGVSVEGDYV